MNINSGVKTHIKNPNTNRMIRIGGRTYNDLVRNNLLNIKEENKHNKVVYEGASKEEVDAVGDRVKEYETILNPPSENKYYVRKGDKVRERKKTMSRLELTNDIQRRCLDLYIKHKHLFTKDMKKEEVQRVLNDLLHKDLAGLDTSIKKKRKFVLGKVPANNFYDITETDLETDYSDTEVETDIE